MQRLRPLPRDTRHASVKPTVFLIRPPSSLSASAGRSYHRRRARHAAAPCISPLPISPAGPGLPDPFAAAADRHPDDDPAVIAPDVPIYEMGAALPMVVVMAPLVMMLVMVVVPRRRGRGERSGTERDGSSRENSHDGLSHGLTPGQSTDRPPPLRACN